MVLDEARGKAWCQSLVDEYVGYVDAKQVAIGAAPAPTHFVATMGSYLYEKPDLRSATIDFLPRHSAVVLTEAEIVTRGTAYARLDTGGFVPFRWPSPGPPPAPPILAPPRFFSGSPLFLGGSGLLRTPCSW